MKRFDVVYDSILKLINEARKPEAEYKSYKKGGKKEAEKPDEIDSIVATLKESDAGKATKMANVLIECKKKEEEIDKQLEEIKGIAEEIDNEFFDAKDFVYTRVLKTGRTMVKYAKIREGIKEEAKVEDVRKAFDDIAKLILEKAPELVEALEKIRAATIKVKITDAVRKIPTAEVLDEAKIIDSLKAMVKAAVKIAKEVFKDVKDWLKKWGSSYDKSLDEINTKIMKAKKA